MKKYAVAIDFGTSNSGAAYARISDGIQARPEFLPYKGVNGIIPKVPTALLIEEGLLSHFKSEGVTDTEVLNAISVAGNSDSLIYFGVQANRYRNKRGYCYFSDLKMLLYNYKKTPNVMAVCTNTKKEYPLDLVIEIMYRVLKNQMLKVLQNIQGSPVSEDECVWGITTPAIWKRDGGAVNNRIVKIVHRVFKDERMLDEATASLYGALRQNILSGSRKIFKQYMIIDVGGGTTDVAVTSLIEDGGHLAFEEKCPPSGCAQGGTDIDRRFWLFLVKRMIKGTSAELIYKNDHELLGKFIYAYVKENPKEFEINMRDEWLKAKLSLENRNEFRLPESFREWVSAVHNVNVPKCIDFSVGEYNREVIDPCADVICGLVSKIVDNLLAQAISIDEIRLVGGGSLDNWLRQRIDMVLAKKLGKESIKQDNPIEALSAVLSGCAYQLISGNEVPVYKILSFNLYTVYTSSADVSIERANIKSYYKANFPKFNLSDENLTMLYSGQKKYLLPVVLKGQVVKNIEQPCCFWGRELRDIFVRSDELIIGLTEKNVKGLEVVKEFSFKDKPKLFQPQREYVYEISIGEQDFNIYTLRIKDPETEEIKYTERINVGNHESENQTNVQ
ncbi:MAG TPA: hypothetical protein IAB87_06745 [Candidatus Coprenecus merdipullorum]|nr:hypothetical protein [Candidatus Coprenecus merdipullorum]